jgi:hypothetical protein
MNITNKAKFKFGQVVATPRALAAIKDANQSAIEFLHRHVRECDCWLGLGFYLAIRWCHAFKDITVGTPLPHNAF